MREYEGNEINIYYIFKYDIYLIFLPLFPHFNVKAQSK